jgi:hypothetical protein
MDEGRRLPEDWAAEYEGIRPTLDAFTDKLKDLLQNLLDDEDVVYAWSYTWSMSEETFTHRLYDAHRHGRHFDDPLKELPNIAGVGFVMHDLERVRAAGEIVERELVVDEEGTISPTDATAQNSNLASRGETYAFPRYRVSLSSRRTGLPEWHPYEGLHVNVDVQTLLQYACERAHNNLPYEHAESYPTEARQAVAQFAASLAGADADLSQIWTALNELTERYEAAIGSGDLDLDLNGESLRAYLRASNLVQALIDAAAEAGLQRDDSYVLDRAHVEDGVLWLVQHNGFTTLRALDEYLRAIMERAPQILGELARLSTEAGYTPWAVADSIVEWLLLVLRRADNETILMLRYRPEIDDALNTLIGNPIGPEK